MKWRTSISRDEIIPRVACSRHSDPAMVEVAAARQRDASEHRGGKRIAGTARLIARPAVLWLFVRYSAACCGRGRSS
jgi:hypothetical protein